MSDRILLTRGNNRYFEELDNLALEVAVILGNPEHYPDFTTLYDLFNILDIDPVDRTDLLISDIMRELVTYPKKDEKEKQGNALIVADNTPNEHYVEVPAERVYARLSDESPYRKVDKFAFLKLDHFRDGTNTMITVPMLGEETEQGSDKVPNLSWFVSYQTLADMDMEGIRDFLIAKGDTPRFVVKDKVYSFIGNILCQHGKLSLNLQRRLL